MTYHPARIAPAWKLFALAVALQFALPLIMAAAR